MKPEIFYLYIKNNVGQVFNLIIFVLKKVDDDSVARVSSLQSNDCLRSND